MYLRPDHSHYKMYQFHKYQILKLRYTINDSANTDWQKLLNYLYLNKIIKLSHSFKIDMNLSSKMKQLYVEKLFI